MKAMLESQERAYKLAIDIVVKQMTDQISKLQGTVSDLTASLQFTQREVDDLKSTVKAYEKDKKETNVKINNLNEQLESENKKIKEMEEKQNKQEDYSRRKNVRITGVAERGGNETWEQSAAAVTAMLEDKMDLPGLVLERAHRVGTHRDSRPRTIIARFSRYCDREAVLRGARRLKGTNIFVNEDLCAASQAVKSAQFPLMKQARAEGKIAFFRHTKLIIRDKTDEGSAGRGQLSAGDGGAVGGAVAEDRGEPAVSGVVTGTQVAGAWSAKGDAFPPLASVTDGSHPRSPSASAAASQLKSGKRTLRSSVKN